MREHSATRQDLERQLRRLVGTTEELQGAAMSAGKASGIAVGIIAALGAFLWGRRRGRRSR